MTTLIFDWSDWDGPASGHVVVTRRTWRRAPESLHVPWQVVVPVDGRATLDVAHVAGEAVSILWAPRRMASRTDHVLIPDGGEHLAHLLDRVDPSTLEPLPEDLPSAVDLVARAEEAARVATATTATITEASQRAADAAEQARDAATLSQESALSVMPMLSGSVNIAPQGGTLAVDLGRAVNVATGLAGTSGAVDVIFPDVTTPDGRVNPDGLGTLLRVDAGADRLTWPGGTIVHGRPPTNTETFASLVRVSGTVHVIWSAADSIPSQGSGTNQVTKAHLDDVLSGNITVEPGASVIASMSNPTLRGEWRFTNISDSPRSELTLVNGSVAYLHAQDGSDFYVYIEYGPNAATRVSAALPTDGGIPAPGSGWMIASASPTRFGYLDQLRSALGGMVTGSTLGDPKYPVALIIPHREGSMGDDGVFRYTSGTPADVFETTLSTDIPVGRSNADFETYGVKIHFDYLSPEDINRMGGWR